MSELAGVPAAYLTPAGLVALFVLAILTGRLVPRQTLVDVREESAHWRAAYEAERAAHAETSRQLGASLEQGRLTNTILQQARGAAPVGGDG